MVADSAGDFRPKLEADAPEIKTKTKTRTKAEDKDVPTAARAIVPLRQRLRTISGVTVIGRKLHWAWTTCVY